MRLVRRASLVLGMVLVVAVVVGFIARSNAVAQAEDRLLTDDAESTLAEIEALVGLTVRAASTDMGPEIVASSLLMLDERLDVCVVTDSETHCAGAGSEPDLTRALDGGDRSASGLTSPDVGATLGGDALTITAVGSESVVVVKWPVTTDGRSIVTDDAPPEASSGSVVDVDGTRSVALPVPALDGISVVASSPGADLPGDERIFYSTVLALSVVLIALSVVSLVAERKAAAPVLGLDHLTRLPSRAEFEQRVERLLKGGLDGACLLLLDLDDFKVVNDTYGHPVGDEFLKVIARRLESSVRDGDLVARWGGDEFVILLSTAASADLGERRARDIASEVAGRVRIDDMPAELQVQVSVGISVWPNDGSTLAQLLLAADRAMYAAKRSGTVTYVYSGSETLRDVPDRPSGQVP